MAGTLVSEYIQVHRTRKYGDTGWRSFPFILPHLLALRPDSLIDFGCGQSDLAFRLAQHAGIASVTRYDPAIVELSNRPEAQHDVLVNVDVLEHIPDEELDNAIADMASLAKNAIIVIDTAPARLKLSDGRNAHVSLHDEGTWEQRLRKSFPGVRPIKIGRKSRVGFKTFEESLPVEHHARLVRKLRRSRDFERLMSALGLAPRYRTQD